MKEKNLKTNVNIVGVAPLGDLNFEEPTQNKTTSKNCSNLISNHQTLISDHKAITLIALVITIIVMLILVGVTITLAFNNGLFTQAKEATKKTQLEVDRESLLSVVLGCIGSEAEVNFDELDGNLPKGFLKGEDEGYTSESGNTFYVDKYGNISTEKGEDAPPTSPSPPEVEGEDVELAKNYIGNYADIDGDSQPDGIIYADLAVAGSGEWGNNGYGKFSWNAETEGLKQYKITGTDNSFGGVQRDVITAVSGNGTKDRFYVMALDDVDDEEHYWYKSAYGNLDNPEGNTHNDLGLGKTNTKTMIYKWNDKSYGDQDPNDMWKIIQDKEEFPLVTVDEGKWFVPSRAEWAAFAALVTQTDEPRFWSYYL